MSCLCRYHLTDLPSFVSGQHLVLFDPHARYLPGASAAQPGLRVNLQRGRLLQQFPDAFAPYMHFGCSMEVSSFPVPAQCKQSTHQDSLWLVHVHQERCVQQ